MKKIALTSIAACCLTLGVSSASAYETFTIGLDPDASPRLTVGYTSTGGIADANGDPWANPGTPIASRFLITSDGTGALPGSFYTYCVELNQFMHEGSNGATQNYTVEGTTGQIDSTKIGYLQNLFALGYAAAGTGPTGLDTAAAFQAAVWEVVYENDSGAGFGFSTGNMKFTNGTTDSTIFGLANTMLGQVENYAGPQLYSLQVLHSDSKQDYLTVTAVPEPEAYGLALAGLGVVLVLGRRRQRPSV